jgi:hypothetical protein
MNKEEIFSIWAPESSIWSRWAKPVLFAHLDLVSSDDAPPVAQTDASWAPVPEERIALVIDLPGAEGVALGARLAMRGYRPAPLFNALPPVAEGFGKTTGLIRGAAVVDVIPTIWALRQAAPALAAERIPDDAPPVFLLDANRRGPGGKPKPDAFDNRAVCFPVDFPSGIFLAANGIKTAWLVERYGAQPQSDLALALRRWQEAGIALKQKNPDSPEPAVLLEVPRPSWFAAVFQKALVAFRLTRGQGGGFGGWPPDSGGSTG